MLGIQVGEWVLGGHSMGGHCASDLIVSSLIQKTNKVKKLVQWGSWWSIDLHDKNDLSALVVNGSHDALIRSMCSEAFFKTLVPPKTTFVNIQGANHAGFGSYGPQTFPKRDGERTISLDEQHTQVVDATSAFILGSAHSVTTISSKKED
mmetsp:Transcript_27325/g.41833  ORF Transcript_27325/g.41833 Transcript_27325/m.41833 type:complete len:150 (-) Transcript_27325:401-850(-)